jgi:hypothetical protein
MTSQLILGNGHGIAIASDSAVTMGMRRTFETSEKIYPLPMPHRLAVTHAGNVMFHGLPYGTLINEWIRSLGEVQLRSVHLYRENFNSWLLDNYRRWTTDYNLTADILDCFYDDFNRIWNYLKTDEDRNDLEKVRALWQAEIRAAENFDPATPAARQVAAQQFSRLWPQSGQFGASSIEASFEYWFDDVASTDEIVDLAKRYVTVSLESRYPGSGRSRAFLNFVGFGSNEMLPTVCSFASFGAIWDLLYTLEAGDTYADREGSGVYLIRPSGQYDAIDLIFRGFDSGFIDATKTAVSKALAGGGQDSAQPGENSADVQNLGSLIEDSFNDYSEFKKLSGLRRAIAGMPLASLARTAKSLIDVQRLSLDIAGELGTVGGQVDVGTITLKDGFRWIRQKEYGDYID